MSNASKTHATGTKVTAPNGDGFPQPAVVERAGYQVKWDDGSGTHWLATDKLRFAGDAPSAEDVPADLKAQAEWENSGDFYGVTVLSGGYQVRWADDTGTAWIAAKLVRFAAAPAPATAGEFALGTHVQALWPNGQFYGATVKDFDGAKYLVAWDDGSIPSWRERQHIQKDTE